MRTRRRLIRLGIHRLEAESLFADATANYTFQPNKGAAADEENVGCVDGGELLVRMLASTLRRNVGNRAFEDFQESLLHALAGNVASDGRILVLAADLIDLIDVDNALLSAVHIAVCCLKKLQDDVLNVFANVTSFGQRRGVHNGKGHIKHLGEGVSQKRLA